MLHRIVFCRVDVSLANGICLPPIRAPFCCIAMVFAMLMCCSWIVFACHPSVFLYVVSHFWSPFWCVWVERYLFAPDRCIFMLHCNGVSHVHESWVNGIGLQAIGVLLCCIAIVFAMLMCRKWMVSFCHKLVYLYVASHCSSPCWRALVEWYFFAIGRCTFMFHRIVALHFDVLS